MHAYRARIIRAVAAFGLFLAALTWLGAGEGTKLKVTIDGAAIYAGPTNGTQKVAAVPQNKVLDSSGRQGKFYKVAFDLNGIKISGYIHQENVEEISEKEAEELAKKAADPVEGPPSQAMVAARLERRIGDSATPIREGRDLDKAVEDLRPAIAEVFGLEDRQQQKQFACDIYYWLGVALAKSGDGYAATREFRSMFEVDAAIAAALTKALSDTQVSKLVETARKQHQGLLTSYTLSINTEPQGGKVSIDGKVFGTAPVTYSTTNPRFTLEVEAEGFAPVKKTVFMTDASSSETVPLQSVGRKVRVDSVPSGAKVYFDGRDAGQVTECELPYESYGEHKLKLTLDGYADWERPCQVVEGPGAQEVKAVMTINRYAPFRKMGGPASKSFKLPKAVVVDASGNIYVADEGDYKVRRFDPELQSIGWTDPAQALRKLDIPAGLALDAQGFLYVTDSANSCVVKFDRNGKQIAKWGNRGGRGGDLFGPTGIAVDKGNDLYVADTGNHRVLKLSSSNGAVKKFWGKQGSGPGEFSSPTGIAVAPTNEIFIVDKGGRVQRFTAEGVFIAEFGKPGSGDGELGRPLGLCLDADGYVYVADTGNSRVLKFSPEGKLIAKLGGGSGGSGAALTAPTGVAVTDKGVLFVSERDIHQVQEFRVPHK